MEVNDETALLPKMTQNALPINSRARNHKNLRNLKIDEKLIAG